MRLLLVLFTAFGLGASLANGGEETQAPEEARAPGEEMPQADVSVSGAGFFKNRSLRETLALLETEDQPLTRISAAFVEDAVVLLESALEQDGFLQSSGTAIVRDGEEEAGRYAWDPGELPAPPRDLDGDSVRFELEPGVRYHFASLDFDGLSALSVEEARGYFIQEGFLLQGSSAKLFTPGILNRGMNNLRVQLSRMGYADATVEVAREERNGETGDVEVVVEVVEGPRHVVGHVDAPENMPGEIDAGILALCEEAGGAPWSQIRQQDFLLAVRSVGYAEGYPKIEAVLEQAGEEQTPEGVRLNFELRVDAGPRVRIGGVSYGGEVDVKESVLDRVVDVETDSLFSRSAIDDDRLQLGALGVFSSVRATVNERQPGLWDLTYVLTPNERLEASLLAGYGSYEQLRFGVEVMHANLFKRAHRGRLRLIQSFKSASGDYLYSLPQIFGTTTDASVRLFGLNREEVSFDREELGATVGLQRNVRWLGANAALRYRYESIEANNISGDIVPEDVPTDSRVAALTLDLTRDHRDNPLTPRDGMSLSLKLEAAARAIGGEVDYQLMDFRGSWHESIGGGRWLHVGWRHELLSRLGADGGQIPLAKRIFPGGESSIRGYREGRASPRNEDGLIIGAEVSTVLNLEVEQALTRNFSVVGFVDAGLTGERLESWPGEEVRVSAGLGLRYDTIIGPARLEYGHNVVTEPGDPEGALHFALGFPF
ncbi:MAG: BamA/OMP85 family outer membrane protein [Opitutaceae bacterium]